MTMRRQFSPEPTMPDPLSPAAQASEETWVPCPFSSPVAAPLNGVASLSIASAILPASSGCPPSRPVSMTATVAVSPRSMSHAAGRLLRATHHCSAVFGGVRGAVSGDVSDGSLGTKRSVWRRSTSTCATPSRLRRARATVASARPPTGLTDTTPIWGICAPSRFTPSRVSAEAACTGAPRSSVTSKRPVRSVAPFAAAGASRSATAIAVARIRRCLVRWGARGGRREALGLRSRARTSRPRSSSRATTAGRRSSSSGPTRRPRAARRTPRSAR